MKYRKKILAGVLAVLLALPTGTAGMAAFAEETEPETVTAAEMLTEAAVVETPSDEAVSELADAQEETVASSDIAEASAQAEESDSAAASAAASLTALNVTSVPDTIEQGTSLQLTGSVTAASTVIAYLTCGVYDPAGKLITGRTVAPGAASYDLSALDPYVAFDRLPAGSYTFAVIATDASYKVHTLVRRQFTVVPGSASPAADDKITVSGMSQIPDTLQKGAALSISGTVTSGSSVLTSVTAAVYDEAGNLMTGKTVTISQKSYALSELDPYILFDKLISGKYVFKVIATNATSRGAVVYQKAFTVGTAAASDAIMLSDPFTVPASIRAGTAVNVTGTVTSAVSNLTYVTAGIYNSKGQLLTGKTAAVSAKTFQLKTLDSAVRFSMLPAGNDYIFRVYASNGTATNELLYSRRFVVTGGSAVASDSLILTSSPTIPDNLALGRSLGISGTVTSAVSNITSLTCGVYDMSGQLVTGKTVTPGTKSYDLKNVDAYVVFNILPAGSYTFRIIASNASYSNVTMLSKAFTVGDAAAGDVITIQSGTTVPSALAKGKAVVVRGTVTSASTKITSLTVGVYNEDGVMVTGKTVAPNATSYNVNAVDSAVRFDLLAAGTYHYRVLVTNGTYTDYAVTDQSFTVQ